jgi:zinc/manganese transport system substrate-binding protein
MRRRTAIASGWMAALIGASLLAGCSSTAASSPNQLSVIAGENFWGSIVSQIGGSHVAVTSIVTDPNADPHQYESSSTDARAFADANYVILNGAGYDGWGQKLLDGNPSTSRRVLVVADLLGKHVGDNAHFWYDPASVERVADQITADLKSIDSGNAGDYTTQRAAFESALSRYHQRISAIRSQFSGIKVGSTESIFVYMASALGLNLISPPEFMKAVAEGNDPPASSVTEFEDQLQTKQVSILVYNTQTVTPTTTSIQQLATQNQIPIVGISETIQPLSASFQDWQSGQLDKILAKLSGHS